MKWEEFIEACRQKEIGCSARQQEQFVRYAQLLQEWNEKMNLTAITEWEEVLEKHFYEFAGSVCRHAAEHSSPVRCRCGRGFSFPAVKI